MGDSKDNNFDVMRLFASICVVYSHSYALHGDQSDKLFLNIMSFGGMGVDIFFVMSGYLVAKSWISDPDPVRFLLRRSLRVFPALAVVVALSVFVLGAFLSRLAVGEYFSHPFVLQYLQNAHLFVSYALPGVFEKNPLPHAVNGSLWSLPVEFTMYVLVVLLGMLGVIRSKKLVLLAFVVMVAGSQYIIYNHPSPVVVAGTDVRYVFFLGWKFFAGSVLFILKDHIRYNVAGVSIAAFTGIVWSDTSFIYYWNIIAFPYIVIGVCTNAGMFLRIPERIGDLSYGIYLYGFPVQQTVEHFLHDQTTRLEAFCLTMAVTTALAFCSWHLVEKPALSFKPRTRRAAAAAIAPAVPQEG